MKKVKLIVLIIFLLSLIITFLALFTYEKKEYVYDLEVKSNTDINSNINDFGSTKTSDIKYHNFFIKNTGTSIIKIDKIVSTCDCVIANYNTQVINPNEELIITIKFIAKKALEGNNLYKIFVFGNFDSRFIKYTIKGNVKES